MKITLFVACIEQSEIEAIIGNKCLRLYLSIFFDGVILICEIETDLFVALTSSFGLLPSSGSFSLCSSNPKIEVQVAALFLETSILRGKPQSA
jgi:hypothetical protein